MIPLIDPAHWLQTIILAFAMGLGIAAMVLPSCRWY